LLENTENMLKVQIQEIKNLKTENIEFAWNLSQKEITLQHQLDIVIHNKTKFKNSLL
jgi:hypothetical protein